MLGLRLRFVIIRPYFAILFSFIRQQVAIVSIMAALLQLSLFTSFMVGDKCDIINKLLKEFASRSRCFAICGTTLNFHCTAAVVNQQLIQVRSQSRG